PVRFSCSETSASAANSTPLRTASKPLNVANVETNPFGVEAYGTPRAGGRPRNKPTISPTRIKIPRSRRPRIHLRSSYLATVTTWAKGLGVIVDPTPGFGRGRVARATSRAAG